MGGIPLFTALKRRGLQKFRGAPDRGGRHADFRGLGGFPVEQAALELRGGELGGKARGDKGGLLLHLL